MGKIMHERKICVSHVSIPEFLTVWKSVQTLRLPICGPQEQVLVSLINTEWNTAAKLLSVTLHGH